MQPMTFLIISLLYFPFSFVLSLPYATVNPTPSKPQVPLPKDLIARFPDWPSLPYSQTYTPQNDKFKAVKLTFRIYGPMISTSTTNTTKIISTLRSAIESQKPQGQLRQGVSAIGEGLKARFSLPRGRSTSNTWYCLTALDALQQQFQTFGAREIKADVYHTEQVAVNVGTIVIAQDDKRRGAVTPKANKRKSGSKRKDVGKKEGFW